MRFSPQVFDAVREAFPAERPVWMRLSATDGVEGGWDIAGTVAPSAARWRGRARVVRGVSPRQRIAPVPNDQLGFATAVKNTVSIPVIAVGLITEPEQAEAIVADGLADAVSPARAMLYDQPWPRHAAAALGVQVRAPKPDWRSQPRACNDLFEDASFGQR